MVDLLHGERPPFQAGIFVFGGVLDYVRG
jgi:hypothetical protein